MSNFTTQNTTTDYIAIMMKRDEKMAKMVANMKANGIVQALKDAKQAVEDAEVALYIAKEQEKEVEAKKGSGHYDFKNFDSKSFAAWAKSSSAPLENTNGRLRTF
jgi:hypothetical protein